MTSQHCTLISFCSSTNTMACIRHRAGKHLLLSKDWRHCPPAPMFTLTHPRQDYCWVATSFHRTCNRKWFKGSSWSCQPFGWNSCYLFASALQMHPKLLSLLSPSFHLILSSQACCFWVSSATEIRQWNSSVVVPQPDDLFLVDHLLAFHPNIAEEVPKSVFRDRLLSFCWFCWHP